MTLLNYTDFVPTPAPLAAGVPIQSYTDPTGEVWVAKGGVNGGQFMRARDVLYARWYRNTTLSLVAGVGQNAVWDTPSRDLYGLYTQGTGFVLPIAGLWLVAGELTVTATAAGQGVQVRAYIGGTAIAITQSQAGGAGGVTATLADVSYYAAGLTLNHQVVSTFAVNAGLGSSGSWGSVTYLGTG